MSNDATIPLRETLTEPVHQVIFVMTVIKCAQQGKYRIRSNPGHSTDIVLSVSAETSSFLYLFYLQGTNNSALPHINLMGVPLGIVYYMILQRESPVLIVLSNGSSCRNQFYR